MSADARSIFVTGATGFLGKLLLEALLRRGAGRVTLLIRPRPERSARERFRRELAGAPCLAALPAGWTRRVEVVEGDLEAEGCGLDADTTRRLRSHVTHVLHAAASVDFDLPLAAATAANVTSSLNALALARGCQQLRSFVAVSTAYVTPHPGFGVSIPEELAPLPEPAPDLYARILSGEVHQAPLLERSGHPNTYTLTKSLCEHLLVRERGGVPLLILRPSIISASWRRPFPGWIDSAAAFAAFVALIGSGHLRAVVGDPATRLNLVPADWVAERAVVEGAEPGDGVRIRHAVATSSHSPRIDECREAILGFFRSHPVNSGGRRAAVPYLGPPGMRFRLADNLHNRAPVRLAMLRSARDRRRGRRLLGQLEAMNRIFPYFTQRSFEFRSSEPFDDPGFDRRAYLSLVCEGVARHLLRSAPADAPPQRAPGASPA